MTLRELIQRQPLVPGTDSKIPWHEPDFSGRMLDEHLNPDHDLASRRPAIVDAQVEWLESLLPLERGQVLDLGCGPGLHTQRLAAKGHSCVGIDFSPASIDYAREQATKLRLSCDYRLENVLEAELPTDRQLIYMLFGEMNTFQVPEIDGLLRRAKASLSSGGAFAAEFSTPESIRAAGEAPERWYTRDAGLFGETPHLVLEESGWFPEVPATSRRWYVVDGERATVRRMGETLYAYTEGTMSQAFLAAGFVAVSIVPSQAGKEFFYVSGRVE